MKKVLILPMIMSLMLCGCSKPLMPQLDTSKRIYDTFFNMPGYEAEIKLSVFSNNTNNVYTIKQYYKYPDKLRSEASELITIVNGTSAGAYNAKADAPLILQQLGGEEDYMFLNSFFSAYYQNEETTASVSAEDSCLVTLEAQTGLSNPYKASLRLVINTHTMEPLTLEILGKDGKVYTNIQYLSFKITDPPDELFVI